MEVSSHVSCWPCCQPQDYLCASKAVNDPLEVRQEVSLGPERQQGALVGQGESWKDAKMVRISLF